MHKVQTSNKLSRLSIIITSNIGITLYNNNSCAMSTSLDGMLDYRCSHWCTTWIYALILQFLSPMTPIDMRLGNEQFESCRNIRDYISF